MSVASRYVVLDSGGNVVATIGTSLPSAACRACSKTHAGASSSTVRPFYCYEFSVGGAFYYFGFAGVSGTMGGLACNSDLNRTAKAPYAFSANGQSTSHATYGVPQGTLLYLYGCSNPPVSSTSSVTNGMTVYDAAGTSFTVGLVYDITITAVTNAVGGAQVGNIAIYDGTTLVAGSVSKTSASKASTYSATLTKTSQSATVKIVATALVGSTSTSKAAWHQSYFFNGLTKAGAAVADGDIAFSEATATYKTTVTDSTTFVVDYGAKHALTISNGAGVSGSTVSYARHHSTGNYVSTTTSPVSLSGSGTLYVESGQTVSIAATAADGYVFYTNAITSSASGYGSISGDGSTSISGSKICSGATTFTITGKQFYITPSIVSHGDWGTAEINYSSGSHVLKPNTTYTLGFTSSTASTYGAVVDYWSIGGSNYTTTFTTGSKITSSITAYLYLRRTKYQLTVAMSAENDDWGSVSGGGWYASGTTVNVVFTPGADYSQLGVSAYQVNYNGETASCGNTATIVTGAGDYQATMYIRQTKFRMSLAYGSSGTDGWGTIAADKEYVGTGDVVNLSFTPTADLVSTLHPQVDHWSVLLQSPKPTANEDGSSTVAVTLGTVAADFAVSAYLVPTYRKVTILRADDGGDAAWGSFYLDAEGTTKEKYYAPGTTIALRFVRNTSYDTKERPQVGTIALGSESTIYGVDGTYEYTYDLPDGVKDDLAISCSLKQTAYAVSVSTDGHGSLMAQRMSIATGTVMEAVTSTGIAKTLYLRYDRTAEYLALTPTGNAHYGFSAWTRGNLSTYDGDAKKVQLSTAGAASVSASFARTDFLVTCTSDDTARADTYLNESGAASGYFDKETTQDPVVVCKLKSSYAGEYKVASWTVGSQGGIESQYNAQGDFYYVEVTGRSDVTVKAHVVRTAFSLAVNLAPANYAMFGTVEATIGGQAKQFSESDTSYAFTVKEGVAVSFVFTQKYGGRIVGIDPSAEIGTSGVSDESLAFNMPSADCSVTFTLGEKERYPLTVGVVNSSSGEESNIPATLSVKSRTYTDIVLGETDATGVAKTFSAYKDEEYSLVATAVSDTLSRRYTILGWKDDATATGYLDNADGNAVNVLNETTDALTRLIVYGLRETGTVTIEYAQKSGGEITTLDDCPAGCSFTLENTADKVADEDKWLIGADIKMPYTVNGIGFDKDGDAYKWTPVEVDIAFGDDGYSANASWDDGLLTQSGEFAMRGNVKIRVVFVETYVPGYTAFAVGYKGVSNIAMGSVSLFATDMDAYTESRSGAQALVRKTKKAVIMAAPRPGFAFAGWYRLEDGEFVAVAGAKAVYEIACATSPMSAYYAEFVGSTISSVKQWNGDPARAKTFEWRSRIYVGAQFFKMQSVRVYADAYPVTLTVFAASSPDDVFGSNAQTEAIVLADQDARRIPKMRPEKYFAFKVSGYSRINLVGIASSMGGLLT